MGGSVNSSETSDRALKSRVLVVGVGLGLLMAAGAWFFASSQPQQSAQSQEATRAQGAAGHSGPGGNRSWKNAEEVIEAFQGTRVGNQTVPEACEKNGGSSMSRCLARLARQGISPGPTDTVRDVAKRHSLQPLQVVQVMLLD